MSKVVPNREKRPKTGGRQKGTLNRITLDIRQALRDLAEGNAHRVEEWFDRVAETDPAEAIRLWLSMLRFVIPTLQAAAITDVTANKSVTLRLAALSDEQLLEAIVHSPESKALVSEGVKSRDELLLRLAKPVTATVRESSAESSTDELLR